MKGDQYIDRVYILPAVENLIHMLDKEEYGTIEFQEGDEGLQYLRCQIVAQYLYPEDAL